MVKELGLEMRRLILEYKDRNMSGDRGRFWWAHFNICELTKCRVLIFFDGERKRLCFLVLVFLCNYDVGTGLMKMKITPR